MRQRNVAAAVAVQICILFDNTLFLLVVIGLNFVRRDGVCVIVVAFKKNHLNKKLINRIFLL